MDPNIHFELPGLPQDRAHSDDNAAYLRRLKAQQAGDAPPLPDAEAGIPSAVASPDGKERRRSPRVERLVAARGGFWLTLVLAPLIGPWLVMAFMRYAQVPQRRVALPILLGILGSASFVALACVFFPKLLGR